MKRIAFLFPGQGAQRVGMGRDWYDNHAAAKSVFEMADRLSGRPLTRLCFEGHLAELTQTANLQPAMTAVQLAALAVLREHGIAPFAAAGHSLGEFAALCAAGVLDAEDTLRLVIRRGALMDRAAARQAGKMTAIVGLPLPAVENCLADLPADATVVVANHNAPQQVVISGTPAGVDRVAAAARERGARAAALKVSGAWHSPLMQDVVESFRAALAEAAFAAPRLPVVLNSTGEACQEAETIKTLMAEQMCRPVYWYAAMQRISAMRIDGFVEVGPGTVLTGLLKKILPSDHPFTVFNLQHAADLEPLAKALGRC